MRARDSEILPAEVEHDRSEFLLGQYAEGIIVRIVGRGTLQNSPAFRAVVEQSTRARVIVFDATACD